MVLICGTQMQAEVLRMWTEVPVIRWTSDGHWMIVTDTLLQVSALHYPTEYQKGSEGFWMSASACALRQPIT